MKKTCSLFLAVVLAIGCLCIPASAASHASEYLKFYEATLSSGGSSGELRLNFDVTATGKMTTLGVEKITLYKVNGTQADTITGTTKNGLLTSSLSRYKSSYTIKGTPGTSYYAVVTFYAGDGSGSDSKEYTTGTARAAY